MKSEKDAVLERVDQFLKELIEGSQIELGFRYEPEDTVINIRLHGKDAGMLLSNNARVLYAINHLLNQIFFRRLPDRCSFVVDCNDYRSRRELELQLLARKAAENVRTARTPLPLQPMPASERRVIHMALADEPGITTMSEGAGENRMVVILPAT